MPAYRGGRATHRDRMLADLLAPDRLVEIRAERILARRCRC